MRQTKRNKRFQYVKPAFHSFAEQNAEQDKGIKSRLEITTKTQPRQLSKLRLNNNL